MKRLLCVTAVLASGATAAFGQTGMDVPMFSSLGTPVFFMDSGGATAEYAGLGDLITRALDKSRTLHLLPIIDDETMRIEAPVSVEKDEKNRVTVKYEITPPKGGSGRVYSTTCTVTQLDRCADAIVQRAERVGREANAFNGG